MYEIDANIFLEVLLDQERAKACREILEYVRSAKISAVISDFNVDGIVIILERCDKNSKDIRRFLLSLLGYAGLRIYHATMIDKIKATFIMEKHKLDFDDSLVVQCALNTGCEGLISIDADFKKVKEINCMTPEEALEKMKTF